MSRAVQAVERLRRSLEQELSTPDCGVSDIHVTVTRQCVSESVVCVLTGSGQDLQQLTPAGQHDKVSDRLTYVAHITCKTRPYRSTIVKVLNLAEAKQRDTSKRRTLTITGELNKLTPVIPDIIAELSREGSRWRGRCAEKPQAAAGHTGLA